MEHKPEQIPQGSAELDLRFAETPEQIEALQKLIKSVRAAREGVVDESDEDRSNSNGNAESNIDGNPDEIVRKLGV